MLKKLSLYIVIFIGLIALSGTIGLLFIKDFSILGLIQDFYSMMIAFHQEHPLATPFLFISIYILYAFFALPGIFILTVLAGFLFPQPLSTIYVAFGATVGASLLFLTARFALGDYLYHRSNHLLKRLEKGFLENSVSFLLFLRLIPVFPFWGINLASAYFGVSLKVFVATTFVGMLPTIIIFTQAGQNLQEILHSSEPLSPALFFNTKMIFVLAGLSALSLIPFLYKKMKVQFE